MITTRKKGVLHLMFFGLVAACIFALAFGWLVMLLWNALVPDLFSGPSLTYWQSVGLLILAHLIFRPQFRPPNPDQWRDHPGPPWANYFRCKFRGEEWPPEDVREPDEAVQAK